LQHLSLVFCENNLIFGTEVHFFKYFRLDKVLTFIVMLECIWTFYFCFRNTCVVLNIISSMSIIIRQLYKIQHFRWTNPNLGFLPRLNYFLKGVSFYRWPMDWTDDHDIALMKEVRIIEKPFKTKEKTSARAQLFGRKLLTNWVELSNPSSKKACPNDPYKTDISWFPININRGSSKWH